MPEISSNPENPLAPSPFSFSHLAFPSPEPSSLPGAREQKSSCPTFYPSHVDTPNPLYAQAWLVRVHMNSRMGPHMEPGEGAPWVRRKELSDTQIHQSKI